MNKIRSIRKSLGLTQAAMSERFGIPKRTIEDWEAERREPADYLVALLERVCDRKKAIENFREACEKSQATKEIRIVREGQDYTLYIDDYPCGSGYLEHLIDDLVDWLEKGRTIPDFLEESQQCR